MGIIVYTDGSSTGKQGKAGAAAVIFNKGKGLLIAEPIPYDCGNNTAELTGILIAIRELPPKSSAKIYTDSNNCIMWLTGDWNRNNPQVKAVADEIDRIWEEKDLNLSFQWVKSHAKIKWNELADKTAKRAKETNQCIREEIAV